MEPRTTVVTAADGRELGVCRWGDPDGVPVILLHGTPGSRFLRHPEPGYRENHLHVVTYDRPGYGISTPHPGHRVADAASDVLSVVEALGLDRFGVAGVSSGGPRALAVAALLPERVTRRATVVAAAPFDADGLDFYAGMDDDTRAGWRAAEEDGAALDADCAETLGWARAGLPGVSFDDAEVEAMMRATFVEAFRQDATGYREDRLALVRPWGFALDQVRAPIRLMVAREDSSVPQGHWNWLVGHVPGAELVPVDGGHLGPRDAAEMELMAWLGS